MIGLLPEVVLIDGRTLPQAEAPRRRCGPFPTFSARQRLRQGPARPVFGLDRQNRYGMRSPRRAEHVRRPQDRLVTCRKVFSRRTEMASYVDTMWLRPRRT